jgi:3-(3-hydroxy-phenyl)propionate hydroxylase
MFVQTPHNNRRWEWMLLPGDDREKFLQDETIHALLSPHIDVSKIDIYRRRVYDFHAIIAEHFQQGRVFLAGDAAHMTPPFAGQGLNSGVRDALNLGWKLVAVLTQGVPAKLLESYELERWTHAKELIDVAVSLGEQIQPTNPEAAAQRDAAFAELSKDPNAVGDFVGGIFKALLDRYFSEGFAVGLGGEYLAGRMISQPTVTDTAGNSALLDTYLGDGFAILGYNCDPQEELGKDLAGQWQDRGVALVGLYDQEGGDLTIAQNSHLAELFGQGTANLVLLRPDRFCLAAFDRDNAADVLGQASAMLGYQ